ESRLFIGAQPAKASCRTPKPRLKSRHGVDLDQRNAARLVRTAEVNGVAAGLQRNNQRYVTAERIQCEGGDGRRRVRDFRLFIPNGPIVVLRDHARTARNGFVEGDGWIDQRAPDSIVEQLRADAADQDLLRNAALDDKAGDQDVRIR